MAQLQSFATWLAGHAGLVKSLSMKRCYKPWGNPVIDGLPYEAHLEAAQELLQLSIHAAAGAAPLIGDSMRPSVPVPAAAGAAVGAAAAAAAAAATTATVTAKTAAGSSLQQQQQQQQQQGLRLHSFSSSLPKAVDMLAVLQVQHLTHVEMNFPRFHGAVTDSSALSMALGRLSNLQQLRLGDVSDASLWAALTTLVHLPQLTSLEFQGEWTERLQVLQQLLAQPLPLRSLQLPDRNGPYQLPVLDMALLTKLTELSTGTGVLAEATVLPAQLQRLQIDTQLQGWGTQHGTSHAATAEAAAASLCAGGL
jgi:hypothetical protein